MGCYLLLLAVRVPLATQAARRVASAAAIGMKSWLPQIVVLQIVRRIATALAQVRVAFGVRQHNRNSWADEYQNVQWSHATLTRTIGQNHCKSIRAECLRLNLSLEKTGECGYDGCGG